MEISYEKCAEHLLDCIGSFGTADVRYFGEEFESLSKLTGLSESELIDGIQSTVEELYGDREDINNYIYGLLDTALQSVLSQCTDKINELRESEEEIIIEYLRKIGIETQKLTIDIPEDKFIFGLQEIILENDIPLLARKVKDYIEFNTTEPDEPSYVLDSLELALEKYRDNNSIYTNCMDSHFDMNGLFPVGEEDINTLIEKFFFNIYEKYIL